MLVLLQQLLLLPLSPSPLSRRRRWAIRLGSSTSELLSSDVKSLYFSGKGWLAIILMASSKLLSDFAGIRIRSA